MQTYVLVHGAWHTGRELTSVAAMIGSAGHQVFTPTIKGNGPGDARTIGLPEAIASIVDFLIAHDLKDIVLVGHSSAGFVITQAAEQIGPSVASIVYLEAFVPQPGDNLISLANPGPRKALEDAVARGDLVAKPVPAAAFKVNEKDRAWVDAKCTPHPLAAVTEKITAA